MISDLTARKLASEWHGGQSSPLYALASSGAIVGDCLLEIADNIRSEEIGAVRHSSVRPLTRNPRLTELKRLYDYVTHCGARGPQTGWALLTW